MGYTHYFRNLQPSEDLACAAADFIENADCEICGAWGKGDPILSEDCIALNGSAENKEDCESFYLKAGEYDINFCKTAHYPYDAVVGAILIYAILDDAEGSENIASDGHIFEWERAISLYEDTYDMLADEEIALLADRLGYPYQWDGTHIETRDDFDQAFQEYKKAHPAYFM